MIECECCRIWFNPDEIRKCPECDIEICGSCFDRHIQSCMGYDENCDNPSVRLDIPKECPKCESELELDVNYETTFLLCPECDFEIDVTDEFNQLEDDEVE